MASFGCPLWGPDGDPVELDGAWLGIVDASAEELHVPVRSDLEPLVVPQPRDASLCTSRFVWNGALELCRVFASGLLEPGGGEQFAGRPLRAVEIGTGTGVCAAALGRCSAGYANGAQILATDLPEAIWLARETVRMNSLDGIVDVAALDWSCRNEEDAAWSLLEEADVVFGADVTYSDQLLQLVLGVLLRPCRNGSVALLSHEHRYSKAEFENDLSQGLQGSGIAWAELPRILPKSMYSAPWRASSDESTASADNMEPVAERDCDSVIEGMSVYIFAIPTSRVLEEASHLSCLGAIACSLTWHPPPP